MRIRFHCMRDKITAAMLLIDVGNTKLPCHIFDFGKINKGRNIKIPCLTPVAGIENSGYIETLL